jgi:hypothetical protein
MIEESGLSGYDSISDSTSLLLNSSYSNLKSDNNNSPIPATIGIDSTAFDQYELDYLPPLSLNDTDTYNIAPSENTLRNSSMLNIIL